MAEDIEKIDAEISEHKKALHEMQQKLTTIPAVDTDAVNALQDEIAEREGVVRNLEVKRDGVTHDSDRKADRDSEARTAMKTTLGSAAVGALGNMYASRQNRKARAAEAKRRKP
ncbi:hypothetical protein GOV07_00310, partial [Candidatus Woesearchaeota archaeon]|nr:hypothetical protein [Candidatus Woesearchaeota archaeon]